MKEVRVQINDREYRFRAMMDLNSELWIHIDGQTIVLETESKARRKGKKSSTESETDILAPMPGKILKLKAAIGQRVKKGETLVIMEAMKMEYSLASSMDGKVKSVHIKEGDNVQLKQCLVEVEKGT